MTRLHVAALLARLRIRAESNAHGLTMIRTGIVSAMPFAIGHTPLRQTTAGDPFGPYRREAWRLRCGSGIAGNSGVWHLAPVSNLTRQETLGPYKTQRELAKALRAWRRWELP